MFKNLRNGDKAEAVDEEGVWHVCRVVDTKENSVLVNFTGWSSKFDRTVTSEKEIRPITTSDKRSRHQNPTKGTYEVSLFLSFSSGNIEFHFLSTF